MRMLRGWITATGAPGLGLLPVFAFPASAHQCRPWPERLPDGRRYWGAAPFCAPRGPGLQASCSAVSSSSRTSDCCCRSTFCLRATGAVSLRLARPRSRCVSRPSAFSDGLCGRRSSPTPTTRRRFSRTTRSAITRCRASLPLHVYWARRTHSPFCCRPPCCLVCWAFSTAFAGRTPTLRMRLPCARARSWPRPSSRLRPHPARRAADMALRRDAAHCLPALGAPAAGIGVPAAVAVADAGDGLPARRADAAACGAAGDQPPRLLHRRVEPYAQAPDCTGGARQ